MSSEPGSISATHIWKRFKADKQRRNIRDQARTLGRRIIGRQKRGWTWALKDVELIARPGEAIGLMGANGSGKSTLLKVLTRVMYPYAGSVDVRGRVGALIEVRAGIHPELTGRENAFLYGSLLGLGRKQVAQRFDEIVAFAQLEEAIDRQVKFFSSGMQMRLGFAVAAFLEPDVLLVDEILAVGDAAFQQRCLDRMSAVLAQGTTLVFVSHDLAAIEAVCSRGVWLNQGVVEADGPIRQVLAQYRHSVEERSELAPQQGGLVRLVKAEVTAEDGLARTQQPAHVTVVVESPQSRTARVTLGFSEGPATPVFVVSHDVTLREGETRIEAVVERLPLPHGTYYLWVALLEVSRRKDDRDLLPWQPVTRVDVAGPELDATPRGIVRLAPVHVPSAWTVR